MVKQIMKKSFTENEVSTTQASHNQKEMNNATIIAFVPILLFSVMNSNSLPFVNLFNCPIHFDPFLSHCVQFSYMILH